MIKLRSSTVAKTTPQFNGSGNYYYFRKATDSSNNEGRRSMILRNIPIFINPVSEKDDYGSIGELPKLNIPDFKNIKRSTRRASVDLQGLSDHDVTISLDRSIQFSMNPLLTKSRIQQKNYAEIESVHMVQLLQPQKEAITCLEFSSDSKYLAASGKSSIIYIFRVDPIDNNDFFESLIDPKPYRTFAGHDSQIVSLSWGISYFLLSSSSDSTVCLWNITSEQFIHKFRHSDFVVSVYFHPLIPSIFLSVSIDGVLRKWGLPDCKLTFWENINEVPSILSIIPNGEKCIIGTLHGECVIYDITNTLLYEKQFYCKNSKGTYKNGSRVVGIDYTKHHTSDDLLIVITTNDSRLRLYNFKTLSLVMKFKGITNYNLTFGSKFDLDGYRIVSLSENGEIYFYRTYNDNYKRPIFKQNPSKTSSYESFKCVDKTDLPTSLACVPLNKMSQFSEIDQDKFSKTNLYLIGTKQGYVRILSVSFHKV